MKILFATDGTKQSEAAMEMLKRFRLDAGDEIRAVSVIDMAVPMAVDIYGGYLPDSAEFERTAREHAGGILDEAVRQLGDHFGDTAPNISTEVLFGSPESRIVEAAEDFKPDLIVLGSHGYKAWERMLLGSVSDSVLHHVHCSVLIARCAPENS
jgi:nucleotide-binding universal stress UspA family protein